MRHIKLVYYLSQDTVVLTSPHHIDIAANLAVAGTTVYFAYKNRNQPRWDRRVVSATVIGLAAWFGVQGYAELLAIRWVLID